jgi:RimJ/RimL family protein N-acetyltransferase
MPGARIASDDRVTLRTVEEEDRPFQQRAFTNPELRYPLGTPLKNRAEVEEQSEGLNGDQFLVCIEGDDAPPASPDEADDVRPIGFVAVKDADWKRPELVYWLIPDVHGQGYGKAAVSLVLDYVFRTYDAPAVGAGVFPFNDASRGLLESLGFSEEGRMREFMFVDGEHRDYVQYGLLRREWQERSEQE